MKGYWCSNLIVVEEMEEVVEVGLPVVDVVPAGCERISGREQLEHKSV